MSNKIGRANGDEPLTSIAFTGRARRLIPVAHLWRSLKRRMMCEANAASQRERANARRAAATTGDEDGTATDNRTHARTAPAN